MTHTMQIIAKWPTSILLLIVITACSGTPRPALQKPVAENGKAPHTPSSVQLTTPGQEALEVARTMLGSPYRYGGNTPNGFDCSGLVQYAFNRAGIKLPHSSQGIFRASQIIDPRKIRSGDLVFFAISSGKISHVGIYAERNRFIHSPSSGKEVSFASMENPYWQKRLIGVGRF